MTTITDARETLYGQIFNNITTVPTTRVTFDNEKFDPPADLSWVRVAVRHFGGTQFSLGPVGSRKFSRTGAVFAQVFIPQDEGVRAGDIIVNEIRTLVEGKTLGTNIMTWDSEVRETGLIDGYFMFIVETRFEYQETR